MTALGSQLPNSRGAESDLGLSWRSPKTRDLSVNSGWERPHPTLNGRRLGVDKRVNDLIPPNLY